MWAMMSATVDEEYLIYLFVWLLAPICLFRLQSRGRRQPGFLIYSYYIFFFINHWFGAFAHASPWAQFLSSENTVIGFKYSTWGLMALLAGSALFDAFTTRSSARPPTQQQRLALLHEAGRAAKWGLAPVGVLAWILTFTPVAQLPSMGAVLSVAKQCLILALCLLCWVAWEKRAFQTFWGLVALSMVLPVITVSTSGFIGYGITMVTTILAFIAMFYRPRFHLLLGLTVFIYGGLCLWVGYAANRSDIREAAWGEQNSVKTFNKFVEILTSLQPFDIADQSHLDAIDARLNQNELIGAAVGVTPDVVPFRDGETVWMAVAAVIPRAIWPEKPDVGGSGNYVSENTLIPFAEGTSVGMGQVFEFYINFGLTGVVIGFLILGAVLRYGDVVCTEALAEANWQGIVKVFLIGSGLVQNAGGSLMEVGASCATGYVLSIALKRALSGHGARPR
jgi:hypothetical protein